ncbi:MAG TPA: cytochrome c biogenesis protein CcdA [Candidatus Limnocylindria bacterium]|nr:cytochrome c biogenesis protein CcdA [Candidatus Limnocylindria bacterium]
MNALVYTSSLAASFLGGILALFAPCCVVSLLPTFVGTAAARGRQRLPMTALIFAAGVAAVLLPVVLGIGALGQVFAAQRRIVFFLVGIVLAILGFSVLSGRQWMLPMPALRLRVAGDSAGSVFLLGLVSGIASSCCAPVVAGVVAMSALASSIPGSLGLGLSYVFGMVFPLLLAALFWDQVPAGVARWRPEPLRIGQHRISWPGLVAGVMFLGIGSGALYLAITGQMSYSPAWLTAWNHWATGVAADLAAALRRIPVAVQALGLVLLATGLAVLLYGPQPWRRPRKKPAGPASASAALGPAGDRP